MIWGTHMKKAVLTSTELIKAEMEFINAINVFPVADGDTGTNMYYTLKGVADAIADLEERSISVVADAVANAALESARGNSGVILSQFFWGFREGVDGREFLDIPGFARALWEGTRWAYQAVANPVEGTILTVMRETSESAKRLAENGHGNDVRSFMHGIFQSALRALEKTPELLKKLGKPKIVDSGGYGFVLFLEGFVRSIGVPVKGVRIRGMRAERERGSGRLFCTNYLLKLENGTIGDVRSAIIDLGDSIVVIGGNGKVKVHIHAKEPDLVRKRLERFGEIVGEKIDPIW